jgi:hypothetical protein
MFPPLVDMTEFGAVAGERSLSFSDLQIAGNYVNIPQLASFKHDYFSQNKEHE